MKNLLLLSLSFVMVGPVLAEVGRDPANSRAAHLENALVLRPSGIYVLNESSNGRSTRTAYANGLTSSPAYLNDIAGHAIFVPIAKILPSITTWGQFNWDWGYLDTLVQIAVTHGKKFSIELETGFQSSSNYIHSLPAGFVAGAGPNSAPLFDVWATGGSGGRCITAYVILPWVPRVQEFWGAAATALAAHLHQAGTYGLLTLVHIPGLSIYDEELRLPTGRPEPSAADTLPCPDGRPAYPTVMDDAITSRWQTLGYSDSAVISGFRVIASAFAQAFPDKPLGLSLLNPGSNGIDFPNLTNDSVGYVASQIVQEVTAVAPGRVQLQSDNLDANFAQSEVINFAGRYSDAIGWQSNKHGETGAGCYGGGAGSCNPDSSNGPYFRLLRNGWTNGGRYLEVWSTDVVNFPLSFAAADSAGFYLSGIRMTDPAIPLAYELLQNYPNPFNPSTTIRFQITDYGLVSLKMYDVLGQEVATLVNEVKQPGTYTAQWDATNVASGVYFYRLQAGQFSASQKTLLMK